MGRTARYLTFEGQFESSVLGTFRIIRGFANLQDLAEISVPYEMESESNGAEVKGQQRKLDLDHSQRIKRYLESGEQRFLPEVILSIRVELTDEKDGTQKKIGVRSTNDDGIIVERAWRSRNIRVHRVTVDRKKLNDIHAKKLIRRVDGNHRLALADTLKKDPHLLSKYLAPFCIILLGPAGDAADDYSESLIFHTINSTAMPLESEHALKLILGQHPGYDMTPESEFAFSPDLHFTRLLRDGLLKLPVPAQARLGSRPLTSLRGAVRGMLEMAPTITKDLPTLQEYSKALLAALNDVVTRLEPDYPTVCKSEFFIELIARVWKATPDNETHATRVNASVAHLERLIRWLGNDGWGELKENCSLSKQMLDIFNAVCMRIPKRVFLARWYPQDTDGAQKSRADLRIEQLGQTVTALGLELIDMGTQQGGTYLIHPKMYEAISSSDIIVVDLTGLRPNVMIEVGYALKHHDKGRLLLYFEPSPGADMVPFDLSSFRYERIDQAAEIPGKLDPHLRAILGQTSTGAV